MRTASDSRRHWAAIDEVSFVAGMRFMFWVCRVFGRWPFRIVLYPVLGWYLLTQGRARRASGEYLRRVRARTGKAVPGVLAHFASFGENLLDKLLLWGGLYGIEGVRFHGAGVIEEAVAAGRGGVLVCSHLGNIELTRVLSRQRNDIRTTVLVHTKHAQAFNRLMGKLNPASQTNLLQVTDMTPATAMMLSERVQRGEFVVIAGDRVPVSGNEHVAMADFMGEPAPFPVGPYLLAGILQCPVYLLFTVCVDGVTEVHIEHFRDGVRLPRQGRTEALAGLARAYAARLEHYALRAPLQWFNFYDFWHLPEQDNKTNDAHAPR
ncbi:putative LPLAT superfamily acyltransferase [Pseudoduganella lurida]|uniref:Putative LPLAT superfamily acyltransferase n=1 Tax=Pseudoduganella lurida TaxID=1036180 RepID=A0A562RD28_9BURK|nr:acyltransferase [Pseudoduganella lurida]TWI66330.1 putative LPLAT superfamily acyltransferase [Pseudoduganella lurida]